MANSSVTTVVNVADGVVATRYLTINPDGSITHVTPAAATPTLTNTAAAASNVANLVALNTARLGLMIFNDSASAMYLKYGTTASLTSFSVKVPALSLWEMPATPRYTGRIDAIWDSATGNARITELTA